MPNPHELVAERPACVLLMWIGHLHSSCGFQQFFGFCGLSELIRHPSAKIATLWLTIVILQERHASFTKGISLIVEDHEIHQTIAPDVGHHRCAWLGSVMMDKVMLRRG